MLTGTAAWGLQPREAEAHHVQCSLPEQFDAFVHFEDATAVVPLLGWEKGDEEI